jgi:MOSC domain-containing protein YiiM
MPIIKEIGISKKKGEKIIKLSSVEALKGKGLIGDRKFKDNNEKYKQVTLIELENILYYNKICKTNFEPLDFRRNIVTKNINLNNLINKEFFLGKVKVKGHDLCRPCKYLQILIKQNNFIKEFLHKGGLRCEILSDGKIFVGDKIYT